MGFYSWLTNDTGVSIANKYSSQMMRTVVMIDNKGNKWYESAYEGYGKFGGKDFYELVAEMNGKEGRDFGIVLSFPKHQEGVIYPNIIEAKNADSWKWVNTRPEECPYQGYFY
jgi:hypothetical protein